MARLSVKNMDKRTKEYKALVAAGKVKIAAQHSKPSKTSIKIPKMLADKLFETPGGTLPSGQNYGSISPIRMTTDIPAGGILHKINNKQGRTVATLDINEEGFVVYPANARKARKPRTRQTWASYFKMLALMEHMKG